MKYALLLVLLISCTTPTVRYIVDGDTFVLENGSTVRMLGIDAPEYGDALYDKAAYSLQQKIQGRQLILQGESTDKYDRLLRVVFVQNRNINAEMVAEGMARIWLPYPEFMPLQEMAQQQKIGMWNIDESAFKRLSHHCASLGCPEGTIAIASANGEVYYNCACGTASKITDKRCYFSLQDAIAEGRREARVC